MNGMKTEQMGSRKKYLAPVVVLLLCLVSLTGAAYAYSSTMTNTGNTIDSDYLSIDLRNGAATDLVKVNSGLVVFTDDIDYNIVGDALNEQLGVNSSVTTKAMLKYQLKIATDLPTDSQPNFVKVKSSGLDTILAKTTQGESKVSDFMKIYVNKAANSLEGAIELTDAGDKLAVTSSEYATLDVYIFVVAMVGGNPAAINDVTEAVVKTKDATNLDHNAEYFAGLIDDPFSITFEAIHE